MPREFGNKANKQENKQTYKERNKHKAWLVQRTPGTFRKTLALVGVVVVVVVAEDAVLVAIAVVTVVAVVVVTCQTKFCRRKYNY